MSAVVFNTYAEYHARKSIRLRGYDYSRSGYYFVTMCIHDQTERLFGNVGDIDASSVGTVGAGSKPAHFINQYGNIVNFTWNDLTNHIDGIALDEFVVMPNHVHGIIQIAGAGEWTRFEWAGLEPAPTDTISKSKKIALPEIIRQFKTFSARRINAARKSPGIAVWQRNYYEHVIRDEKSLFAIRKYIRENPLHWSIDSHHHVDREISEFEMTETEVTHEKRCRIAH
jgi:putative transposase